VGLLILHQELFFTDRLYCLSAIPQIASAGGIVNPWLWVKSGLLVVKKLSVAYKPMVVYVYDLQNRRSRRNHKTSDLPVAIANSLHYRATPAKTYSSLEF